MRQSAANTRLWASPAQRYAAALPITAPKKPGSHTCEHSRAYGRRAKRRKASGAAGGEQGAQQYP
ncbi:MAG: hypothetical protein ACLSH5_08070 [Christensenellales bacterium]